MDIENIIEVAKNYETKIEAEPIAFVQEVEKDDETETTGLAFT